MGVSNDLAATLAADEEIDEDLEEDLKEELEAEKLNKEMLEVERQLRQDIQEMAKADNIEDLFNGTSESRFDVRF